MSDINFESHVGENGTVIKDRDISPNDPLLYSDILKFSICENIIVRDCGIDGGKEDAIDCVRGRNYKFDHIVIRPHGKNGVTAKGGIEGLEFNNVLFTRHGSECDMEFGQHTIYDTFFGKAKTTKIRLINVHTNNGSPVVVKVWNAEMPLVIGGNVKIKKMPWIVVKLYFAFRWIQYHLTKK